MKKVVPVQGRFKLILLFLLAGLTVAVAVIFITRKIALPPLKIDKLHIDSDASLVLKMMHQTSFNDGIKEWSLDAATARLLKNGDQAEMRDVTAIFLTKDAENVSVTSKTGVLNTRTYDMIMSGMVLVRYEGVTLETDRLQYEKKRHIIYSTKAVNIRGEGILLTANALKIDLAKGRITLTGNVKGLFSENFSFGD